jgi:hypothetical protein
MVFKGRPAFQASIMKKSLDTDDPRPSDTQIQENLKSLMDETEDIRSRFEEIWKRLRQDSFNNIEQRMQRSDKFEPGDKVYVWIPKLRREGKCGPAWEGPYTVTRRLTESGTLLEVNGRNEHAYNLKRAITVSPVDELCVPPTDSAPTPPVVNEGDDVVRDSSEKMDISDPPRRSERIRMRDESTNERSEAKRLRIAVLLHFVDLDSPGGELLLM